MKSNPGGLLAIEDIFGRTTLIDSIWEVLDRQSLVLTAERRMGKTSVARKLAAEPRPGFHVVFRDVEHLRGVGNFIESLYSEVRPLLPRTQTVLKSLQDLWHAVGGTEVGGLVKLPESARAHWLELLESIVKALAAVPERRFVMVWDEFPLMLQAIGKAEGSLAVQELLDALRAMRQLHPRCPRMIYTGSIGMHHVIGELRRQGYTNSPLNDMYQVPVPLLEPPDAVVLATRLIAGEGLGPDPDALAAHSLATEVEGMAFYIHHIVAALRQARQAATPQAVQACIERSLRDPMDPWDLQHFRLRLDSYYGERAPAAQAILDKLSGDDSASATALQAAASSTLVGRAAEPRLRSIIDGDRQSMLDLLADMEKDHYLLLGENGRYRFRYSIVKRWWQLRAA